MGEIERGFANCVRSSMSFSLWMGLIAFLLLSSRFANAIDFDMVFQTKCIHEEIYDVDQQVTGTFQAFHREDGNPIALGVRVEDPLGHTVHEAAESFTGAFTISNVKEGEYKICFTAKDYHVAQNTRVRFLWKDGADATDWESVAKRDNLDGINTELLRLEREVQTIHMELQHIRRKEEQMRNVNELTNARVAWFSLGALFICVGTAALQLWNLRKFFIRKKIL